LDNLTHSLIGYALAQSLPQPAVGSAPGLRKARIWAAVVGSNLPDLDFLVGELVAERKLGYLLHHRGHTHTLLFVLLASWPLAWLCGRLAGAPLQRRERVGLLALTLVALLLHIGFDALNDYGVHPFFPFHNGWFYGDAVFIIEPLWWAILAAFLARSAQSRVGRGIGVATGLLAVGLGLAVPGVPLAVPVSCTLLGSGLYAVWRVPARRVAGVWLALGLVLSSFALGSRLARARVRSLPFEPASARPVALSSTPAPGNPLCWVLLVAARTDRALIVQRVQLSLWPQLISADACGRPSAGPATARSLPIAEPSAGDDWRIRARVELSLHELRALAASDCRVRAMLQFTRFPFLAELPEGRVLGDLRYDQEPGLGFAELPLELPGASCPSPSAPWLPPMAELL
jgi:inner membrane protein